MTICEPVSNGLGSDAFVLVWAEGRLHGLNASGRAPAAWTPEYFKRKYGADAKTPPKRGMDAVTVPGAVASWVAMSERFGKLPFADLMEPAIEIAERSKSVGRSGATCSHRQVSSIAARCPPAECPATTMRSGSSPYDGASCCSRTSAAPAACKICRVAAIISGPMPSPYATVMGCG